MPISSKIAGFITLSTLLFGASACSDDVKTVDQEETIEEMTEAFCQTAEDCAGRSADQCVEEAAGFSATAAVANCESEWERYRDCVWSKSTCTNGKHSSNGLCQQDIDAYELCRHQALCPADKPVDGSDCSAQGLPGLNCTEHGANCRCQGDPAKWMCP